MVRIRDLALHQMTRPLTFSEWMRLPPAQRAKLTHAAPVAARTPAPARGGVILNAADPPSLPATRPHRRIFDPAPHRNRGKTACPELAPGLLNRVIATCVAFGMPRAIAEESRDNPYVRTDCVTLAVLVWDAAKGDKRSQAALDRVREAFNNRDAVAESFAALEQPADSGELTRLLGAGQ